MPRHTFRKSSSPAFEVPPLGHVQAIVLLTLRDLGSDASGTMTIKRLTETLKWNVDRSQVYDALRRLQKAKAIRQVRLRPSEIGGPPKKIYAVTSEGQELLQKTADHHTAISLILSKVRSVNPQ